MEAAGEILEEATRALEHRRDMLLRRVRLEHLAGEVAQRMPREHAAFLDLTEERRKSLDGNEADVRPLDLREHNGLLARLNLA